MCRTVRARDRSASPPSLLTRRVEADLVTLRLEIGRFCRIRGSGTTGPVTATSRQSALERVRTGPWPGRHPVSGRESSHRCIWAARVAEYATMPTQTAGRGPIAARSPPGRAVAITDVAWKRPNGPTHATSTPWRRSGRGGARIVAAMALDPRTPVIVGVGQFLWRAQGLTDALEPIALMEQAIRNAVADAGLAAVPPAIGSIRVVNSLSWRYGDPAGLLAVRLGTTAAEHATTPSGGNVP